MHKTKFTDTIINYFERVSSDAPGCLSTVVTPEYVHPYKQVFPQLFSSNVLHSAIDNTYVISRVEYFLFSTIYSSHPRPSIPQANTHYIGI